MEQKWVTAKIEYEGFPLYLRKPDYDDIFEHRDNLPRVLHVEQKLRKVTDTGLPESDYNLSLRDFDGQMCKLFSDKGEGLIFLIETFAGKRNYYYFISESVDFEEISSSLREQNSELDIEIYSYLDKDWSFLKEYPTKLY